MRWLKSSTSWKKSGAWCDYDKSLFKGPEVKAMKILLVCLILAASACATGDDITLRNPISGQITKCPGYSTAPALASHAQAQQRNCVQDYQRQGYERVPQ
jgi:hypothetical protein